MTVTTRRVGPAGGAPATVLEITGDLDLGSVDALRTALAGAVEGGTERVVIDLAGTDFLDSSALGVLVGANKRLVAHGHALTIVCDKPHLVRLFEITRLDRVMTLVPSLDAAVA